MSKPFQAEILGTIADIEPALWDSAARRNPFLKHSFLSALEKSGSATAETGWQPYHICLKDAETDKVLGFMPQYLKSHSYGEYVFDHAWAHAYENAGGSYYPKLQSSVPFTPVTTPRLLLIPGTPEDIAPALFNTVKAATDQLGLSSAHVTFLPEQEAQLAEKQGFLIRTDQQFHWKNNEYKDFDAFLTALSSRKRKQIKKERATALSAGAEVEYLTGGDITEEHWDVFFHFYQDTGARKWGTPYLKRAFFSLIGESMADDILLIMCKNEGRYIAGALNFIGVDTLYGRYWGCLEDHPCLHFEVCYYQAIDYAIRNGLSFVEAGAQGPHKLARGYEPTITYSAHWLPNEGFRDAVARFLKVERLEVEAEVNFLADRTPFKKS